MMRLSFGNPRRRAQRGFGIAPVLYLIGLVGVAGGILFSNYMQSFVQMMKIQNGLTVRNDLMGASMALAAQSVFSADNTTLCPPRSVHQTTGDPCAAAPVGLVQFQDFGNTQLLPNGYASVASTGLPTEVGAFAVGTNKQLDSYGHTYIYCRWENTRATPVAPAFVLISAGPDGILQTTCGNSVAQGDDYMISVPLAQVMSHASLWHPDGTTSVSYGAAGSQVTVDAGGDISATSLTTTGNVSVGANLSANGSINGVAGALSSLIVSGSSSLGEVSAGAVTATSLTTSGAVTGGTGSLTSLTVGSDVIATNFKLNADNTTGIFTYSTNNLAIQDHGVTLMDFFGNAVELDGSYLRGGASGSISLVNSAPSLTTPVYSFRDYYTLGMGGNPSTGMLSLITNSTAQLVITPSGLIGIGTTNPQSTLDVTGSINTSGIYSVNGAQIAASNLSNGTTGSGAVVLATSPTIASPTLTGTTTAATINATAINLNGVPLGNSCTGNCSFTGISDSGALSASSLTVSGSTTLNALSAGTISASSISASGTISANSFSGNGSDLTNIPASSITGFLNSQWMTSGTSIYYNEGNVGIGTSSPSSGTISVYNPTMGGTIYGVYSNLTATWGAAIYGTGGLYGVQGMTANGGAGVYGGATAAWNGGSGVIGSVTGSHNSGAGGYFTNTDPNNTGYGLYSGNSSSTGWGIYSSGTSPNYFAGNVGIGTSNPAYPLAVVGSINSTGSYLINGSQIAASNLSNGTTGSGSIVLTSSPALTGTPTTPTQLAGDTSTAIANDAFVSQSITTAISGISLGSGTQNYSALWASAGTLGTGSIYDKGTGKVSIGTTALNSVLGVSGGISIGSTYVGTTAPTNGAIIQGNVGIGTNSPTSPLSVVGNINITGNYLINGTQIAATNLSNGTTGTGAVALASSPTLTGITTAATINATALNVNGVPITGGCSGSCTFSSITDSGSLTAGSLVVAGTSTLGTIIANAITATSFTGNGSGLTNIPASSITGLTNSQWTTSGTSIYYNSGNVGIGTTVPTSTLTVNGSAAINGTTSLNSSLNVVGTTDFNNLVGIGTNNPQAPLDIYQTSGSYEFVRDSQSGLKFIATGGTNYIESASAGMLGAAALSIGNMNATHTWLNFDTSGDASFNANVGIGTTTTGGTNGVLALSYNGNNSNMLVFTDTYANGRTWGLGDDTGNTCSAGEFCIYDFTAGATRLVITSSGMVGIGTTSSSYPLSVSGNINTMGNYLVNGSQIAASNLSNGMTGTGAVVLAASPALTGTPTAPTATAGTNTTQVATTAFVTTAVANKATGFSSCTTINSSSNSVSCSGGYAMTGGGCIAQSGYIVSSYPSSSTTWSCTNSLGQSFNTAYAICCH